MENDRKIALPSLAPMRLLEISGVCAALGLAFLVINFLHFQHVPVRVILYACVWDAVLANVLVWPLYALWRRRRGSLVSSEILLAGLAANFLILLYSVMGPTVIDRSLSLYIVQKVDQRGGAVSEAAMPDIFIEEYLPEFRLVDVRLTEQYTSGTLVNEEGCLRLTPKGKSVSSFVDWYRRHLLPQKRVLSGEVTDQLTDPFKDTQPRVDFSCAPPT